MFLLQLDSGVHSDHRPHARDAEEPVCLSVVCTEGRAWCGSVAMDANCLVHCLTHPALVCPNCDWTGDLLTQFPQL
jgi:hypothetical protein